jgi:hypothetical protein
MKDFRSGQIAALRAPLNVEYAGRAQSGSASHPAQRPKLCHPVCLYSPCKINVAFHAFNMAREE